MSAATRRGWVVFTTVLMWAVFLQAVTAGRLLRGDDWARDLHRSTAGLLFVATLAAGLVAATRLRQQPIGRKLTFLLVGLGLALGVQHRLGAMAADGEDVLWLHVPVGVAIIGLAAQPNVLIRRAA